MRCVHRCKAATESQTGREEKEAMAPFVLGLRAVGATVALRFMPPRHSAIAAEDSTIGVISRQWKKSDSKELYGDERSIT